MNGFERRKQRKRESIERAALELFRAYGFKRVSVGDVAERAGVSQVTIYTHFGSKDGLVQHVVKVQLNRMLDQYSDIIHADRPFPEKIEAIIFDKGQVASQFGGELLMTVYREYPDLRDSVESLWRGRVGQLLEDFAKDGREQGYIDPHLSDRAVQVYLEIVRRGVPASADSLANVEWNEGFLREVNALFLYGLMGKSRLRQPTGQATRGTAGVGGR